MKNIILFYLSADDNPYSNFVRKISVRNSFENLPRAFKSIERESYNLWGEEKLKLFFAENFPELTFFRVDKIKF